MQTTTLIYGAESNFEHWQKCMTYELKEKYGNYAKFTDGKNEWKPKQAQPLSECRDEADPDSIVQWNVYEKAGR